MLFWQIFWHCSKNTNNMEFIVNPLSISQRTRDLLETKGTQNGCSVEWNVGGGCDLTEAEMKALRHKHKTRAVNYQRAAEVKRLMLKGKKCMEIAVILHRNYKQTMVKKDHAALSPLLGRGGAKKRG